MRNPLALAMPQQFGAGESLAQRKAQSTEHRERAVGVRTGRGAHGRGVVETLEAVIVQVLLDLRLAQALNRRAHVVVPKLCNDSSCTVKHTPQVKHTPNTDTRY